MSQMEIDRVLAQIRSLSAQTQPAGASAAGSRRAGERRRASSPTC